MIVQQKLRYLGVTYDIRYIHTVYTMQGQTLSKIVYTFCFKEWRDFCLLNLIERIKYNLFLSFML